MMLATRCPYCRTMFRVVQDQLKLCNGIVRCGSCRQVFNGIEQLQSRDAAAQAMREEVMAQEKAVQAQVPAWPESAGLNPNPVTIMAEDAPPPPPVSVKTPEPVDDLNLILTPAEDQSPVPTSLNDAPDPLFASPARPLSYDYEAPHLNLDLHYETRREPSLMVDDSVHQESHHERHHADEWGASSASSPVMEAHEPHVEAIEPDDDDPAYRVEIRPQTPEPTYEEPAFVQRAKRQERYGRMGRIALALLVLALLPALFLQSVDAFHLRIAAMMPGARPVLARICTLISCRTDLPAQIESVSIDSYELHSPTKGEAVYTLKVLMRNRSALSQAWPHFELTLKDATETPIVRRVFKANEYLTSKQEMSKGFAGNSEYAIKLQFEVEPSLKPVGYEVYLFYS